MKRLILISLTLLLAIASSTDARVRDVEADDEDIIRQQRISDRAEGREVTRKSPSPSYKAGELLVRFAPKAEGKQRTKAEKQAVLASIGGGNIKRSYHLVPGLTVVKLPEGLTVENALKRFKGKGEILYAEPNYEVYALATPNDTYFDYLWAMHNDGNTLGTEDADIDAPEAWDIETDANEIVVAVIDTGVDYNHEDLAANIWTDANGFHGKDFVNDDNDPMDDHDYRHGTHCAGTIGAVGNNNTGVVGVCWDVQIMAVKFLDSSGSGWTDDAIDAIYYAVENGADVLSNSWGGGGYSEALKEAIKAADANGVLFVAAAGNDSSDNDKGPHYPSSYDCNNIIAVMSTDPNDEMSGFSNYGLTSVDLAAPGSLILSCYKGAVYTWKNGTSMATPHVAGACALLWSEHPTLSYLQVKDTVLWAVDELAELDGKCATNGRLNLYGTLLNKKVKNATQRKWYDTIQDAIDEANDADLIKVRPGTHYETIDFNGVSCTLTSINPDDPCVVAATVIDANGSGTVVTIDANALLAGLTITGGYTLGLGAGVHCSNASPTISKCIIRDNDGRYGGGMYNYGSSPTLINCTLSGNSASFYGGGMYNEESEPNVIDCTFSGNSAAYGGGMYTYINSTLTVTNSVFSKNNATTGAGGMLNHFGSNATVTNCTFYDNQAELFGGGMANAGCAPEITNCLFIENSVAGSTGGGGMYNNACGPILTNCTFFQNDANGDGGAMLNWYSALPTVVNCVFWADDANGSGDEIHNKYGSSDPNISYCDIEGCGGSDNWDPNFGTDGGGNIDADPCFVNANDPNGDDNVWGTVDDGLVLGSPSPCIDAADNDAITVSTDIAGSLRKRDDPCTTDTGNGTPPIVDMGAYEHPANATIYVDVNATGGVYNGLSWGTAFKDLQDAIDYSIAGDEIRVAAGTYLLTSTIQVGKEVAIYGGYDADTAQRDTQNNLTIVDGNDAVRCFYVTADCTVDGFTITDGNAWNPGSGTWTDDVGGGMFNYLCDPSINDCNFYQNCAYEYGGAIENYQANPTITDCNFTGNSSNTFGGGVDNWLSSPALTNCTFSGNTAGRSGGGVYNVSSSPTVTNCTFSGNSAETGRGGGMRNFASDPSVSHCTFSQNDANDDGGGMANRYSDPNVIECSFSNNTAYSDGAGMDNDYSDPKVVECTFSNNTAYSDGAGMDNYFSDPNVIECTFTNNAASDDGGGMYNEESFLTLDDCIFSQNTAGDDGGGMYNDDSVGTLTSCVFWDNNSVDDGGGMYNDDYCPTLINCTFALNESLDDDGGGIYNRHVSDALLINCIIYYNDADDDGDEIYNDDSEPNFSFCDVDDCGGSEDWDPDCGIDGGNNIEEDPEFEDRYDGDGSDDVWGTCDDGLNLEPDSPCIDEGDNTAAQQDYDGKDIKGSDRIIDGDVDMGAYEYDSGC